MMWTSPADVTRNVQKFVTYISQRSPPLRETWSVVSTWASDLNHRNLLQYRKQEVRVFNSSLLARFVQCHVTKTLKLTTES